eukprot:3382561-Pyramimonas_sp.AAC.1
MAFVSQTQVQVCRTYNGDRRAQVTHVTLARVSSLVVSTFEKSPCLPGAPSGPSTVEYLISSVACSIREAMVALA